MDLHSLVHPAQLQANTTELFCRSRLISRLIWRGERPIVAIWLLKEKGKVRGLTLLPPDLHSVVWGKSQTNAHQNRPSLKQIPKHGLLTADKERKKPLWHREHLQQVIHEGRRRG